MKAIDNTPFKQANDDMIMDKKFKNALSNVDQSVHVGQ